MVTTRLFRKKEERINWFWDGAVAGFNNPVLAAVVEAVTNGNGRSMEDYRILSIGTGLTRKAVLTDHRFSTLKASRDLYEKNINNPLVVSNSRFRPLDDIGKIAKSIVSDPPDSATFIAFSFLDATLNNSLSNLVRINPCVTPELSPDGRYEVPDVYRNEKENFLKLINLDMDAVREDEIELITGLCDNFLRPASMLPNQLIRGEFLNAETPVLGYDRYEKAKFRWLEITK